MMCVMAATSTVCARRSAAALIGWPLMANPSEASQALQTEAAAALDRLPVGFALALVENAYHHLHTVELIHAADILAREPELLAAQQIAYAAAVF